VARGAGRIPAKRPGPGSISARTRAPTGPASGSGRSRGHDPFRKVARVDEPDDPGDISPGSSVSPSGFA
jgi:hypothetical protein